MAAANRGTMDATVARMLFLHLPARHPNSFPEIELSPLVQVRGRRRPWRVAHSP
jgi:anaphase-promoting complex subunit 1